MSICTGLAIIDHRFVIAVKVGSVDDCNPFKSLALFEQLEPFSGMPGLVRGSETEQLLLVPHSPCRDAGLAVHVPGEIN